MGIERRNAVKSRTLQLVASLLGADVVSIGAVAAALESARDGASTSAERVGRRDPEVAAR
jgi:hypothetical protein